jgi:hypothetical protein
MDPIAIFLATLSLAGTVDIGPVRADAGQQPKSTIAPRNSKDLVELAIQPFGVWLSGSTARMLVTIRNPSSRRVLLSIPESWVREFEFSILTSPQVRTGAGGGSLSASFHDKKPYCGTTLEAVLGLPPHGIAYRIVEMSLKGVPAGSAAATLHFHFASLDQTLDCDVATKLETEVKTMVRILPLTIPR